MPIRIQRKRTKNWKMPKKAVYVGRPSMYGNCFKSPPLSREDAVRLFRKKIDEDDDQREKRYQLIRELRGRDLVCWCPLDEPCHADVLLEIANG